MDKPRLHSVVLFVDDIESAAQWYSELLLQKPVDSGKSFIEVGSLGFHPADAKGESGSVVPYFQVSDIASSLESAAAHGFVLYRGPLNAGQATIAQVKDEAGMKIGLFMKHGANDH